VAPVDLESADRPSRAGPDFPTAKLSITGHRCDRDGRDVDPVLEATDGRIVAIEVKTAAGARAEWFRGLQLMREQVG
jgi:hypothetical protein